MSSDRPVLQILVIVAIFHLLIYENRSGEGFHGDIEWPWVSRSWDKTNHIHLNPEAKKQWIDNRERFVKSTFFRNNLFFSFPFETIWVIERESGSYSWAVNIGVNPPICKRAFLILIDSFSLSLSPPFIFSFLYWFVNLTRKIARRGDR